MTDFVRIKGAIASKTQVVLYKEDGSTITLQQGDHRLKDLLDEILPIINRGEIAVVSLETFSVYKSIEKKSNGLIRMFKMAKKAVVEFFAEPDPTPEPVANPYKGQGSIVEEATPQPEEGVEIIQSPVRMVEEEVIAGPAYVPKPLPAMQELGDNEDQLSDDETLVAVVDGVMIPGIEQIRPLIVHAVKSNSQEAVHNFLVKLAAVIGKRKHSVEDILRFLEKGDLPLAKDGSIIAYKILRSKGDYYVDCHSQNVKQKIGSYVCVREDLVDLRRDAECSNGLHIARRGYLRNFPGDVCVLCKIEPEDVMTVPHRDPNKVRVKGYHILAELSQEAFQILRDNRPMTGDEASLRAVYDAIEGRHINRIEQVQVNGQMGANLQITQLAKPVQLDPTVVTRAQMQGASAVDDETNIVGAVDPRELNKRIAEQDAAAADGLEEELRDIELEDETDEEAMRRMADDLTASSKAASVAEPEDESTKHWRIHRAYEAWRKSLTSTDFEAMVELKSASGLGWNDLDLTEGQVDIINDELDRQLRGRAIAERKEQMDPTPVPEESHEQRVADFEDGYGAGASKPVKAKTPAQATKLAKKAAKKAKTAKPAEPVKDQKADEFFAKPKKQINLIASPPTKAEEARALYDARDFEGLKAFKKRVKKGWEALGFNKVEITKITK